jgi:hypothetical protein
MGIAALVSNLTTQSSHRELLGKSSYEGMHLILNFLALAKTPESKGIKHNVANTSPCKSNHHPQSTPSMRQ